MSSTNPIELRRDCWVTLVPSGRQAILTRGERVAVVQQLGTSFTVQINSGPLARIDGSDADALGLDRPGAGPVEEAGTEFSAEQVIDVLKTVYDPEIPVNVVDLGLVYRCEISPIGDGRHRVEIDMSMTAPGCGMGDVLRDDARSKVLALRGVGEVEVDLVWDPPWDMSRLSEEARLELGLW